MPTAFAHNPGTGREGSELTFLILYKLEKQLKVDVRRGLCMLCKLRDPGSLVMPRVQSQQKSVSAATHVSSIKYC